MAGGHVHARMDGMTKTHCAHRRCRSVGALPCCRAGTDRPVRSLLQPRQCTALLQPQPPQRHPPGRCRWMTAAWTRWASVARGCYCRQNLQTAVAAAAAVAAAVAASRLCLKSCYMTLARRQTSLLRLMRRAASAAAAVAAAVAAGVCGATAPQRTVVCPRDPSWRRCGLPVGPSRLVAVTSRSSPCSSCGCHPVSDATRDLDRADTCS